MRKVGGREVRKVGRAGAPRRIYEVFWLKCRCVQTIHSLLEAVYADGGRNIFMIIVVQEYFIELFWVCGCEGNFLSTFRLYSRQSDSHYGRICSALRLFQID